MACLTSCSSDREGLIEGVGRAWRGWKAFLQDAGIQAQPTLPAPLPKAGLWEDGAQGTEGESQVLLSAPMRTTCLRANTAQEPKGQRPWKPSFRLRGSGVNPAGAPHVAALTAQSQAASPAPPRGPPQGHAGRDTGTEEMCSAIGGGEGGHPLPPTPGDELRAPARLAHLPSSVLFHISPN